MSEKNNDDEITEKSRTGKTGKIFLNYKKNKKKVKIKKLKLNIFNKNRI